MTLDEEPPPPPRYQFNGVLKINADGDPSVHGTALVRAATSPATLVYHAAGSTASCADVDHDSKAGLTNLVVRYEDRNGNELFVTILPATGNDIDESGTHEVLVITTHGRTAVEFETTIWARLRFD